MDSGMADAEASALVHLRLEGPSTASQLARALSVPRLHAYKTLRTLESKGLARHTLTRPARYEAAAPGALFDTLRHQAAQQLRQIQRAEEVVSPALAAPRTPAWRPLAAPTLRVLEGRRCIYGFRSEMVRRATATFRYVSTHPAHVALAELSGFFQELEARALAGLRVAAIVGTATVPGRPGLDGRKILFRVHDEERVLRFAIQDDREALLWVTSDPSNQLRSHRDVAIWSNAPGFVQAQEMHFRNLWSAAKGIPSSGKDAA